MYKVDIDREEGSEDLTPSQAADGVQESSNVSGQGGRADQVQASKMRKSSATKVCWVEGA